MENEDGNLNDIVEELSDEEPAIIFDKKDRKGEKKKAYTLKRKLEVIDYAKANSNISAAKKFSISKRSVLDWLSQENRLREAAEAAPGASSTKMRLPGGGRKLLSEQMENHVYSWIVECRDKKQRVSRRLIKLKALQVAKSLHIPEDSFSATNGWLDKFMARNHLSLRRPTTTCQRPPSDYIPKLTDFIMYIRSQRMKRQYPYGNIYSADETAVWLDPAGLNCVTQKGSRDVPVLSAGHEKLRITVMLCARADGKKCLPFVMLPRKRPIPELIKKYQGKLILCWEGRVWINDKIAIQFLNKVLGSFSFTPRLLVWDACRVHISQEVKRELRKLKIDTAVVPGGCTKYVQAPDVCWDKPFKDKIGEFHEDWLLNGAHSYTPGGNMRPPPMETYLDWVVDSWESLSPELIENSMKCCGISNAIDGSEDDAIHCFKPHGQCSEGREILQEKADAFNANNSQVIELSDDEPDPEEDDDYNSDISVEMYAV